MAEPAPNKRKCPICGKPAEVAFRPFCSQRCTELDLHHWLSGQYRVPGEDAPRSHNGTGETVDEE